MRILRICTGIYKQACASRRGGRNARIPERDILQLRFKSRGIGCGVAETKSVAIFRNPVYLHVVNGNMGILLQPHHVRRDVVTVKCAMTFEGLEDPVVFGALVCGYE